MYIYTPNLQEREADILKQLDKINNPADIKKLNTAELKALCKEIRGFIIDTVSKNGGHLASNLGITELTVALLYAFDLPDDKIVYDVGHQSYVHKILTGRKDKFSSLRTFGGISGFPKTAESEYDFFDTGHSSTAVSVAYSFAVADKLDGKDNFSVAVVGDASFSNGLTMEGLNNAGLSKTNLIVILNDNDMSISKNVGNFNKYLTELRTAPKYVKLKDKVKDSLKNMPFAGKRISELLSNTKESLKHALIKNTMFEDLGFTYAGPIDGHNIEELIEVLNRVKILKEPVLLHVVTKKGKGYGFAEKMPDLYHGPGPFDINVPIKRTENLNSYSHIFGEELCFNAEKNKDIIAVCSAMAEGTGLEKFRKKYPDRFFDTGISEGHAVTFASGLSAMGKIPIVAIYSTFMQRAYDNIVHDTALTGKHVVFCLDRAGLTGQDGETHHGIFDISFMSHIPGVKIFMPYTKKEFTDIFDRAVNKENCPCVIRYPKGVAPDIDNGETKDIKQTASGEKVTVVTLASSVEDVKNAGFDGDIFYVTSLCFENIEEIEKSLEKTGILITVEDSLISGGMGENLSRRLKERGVTVKTIHEGIKGFVTHGTVCELKKAEKIDSQSLREKYPDLLLKG